MGLFGTSFDINDPVMPPVGFEDRCSPQFGESLFVKEVGVSGLVTLTSDPIHHTDSIGRFSHATLKHWVPQKQDNVLRPEHYNDSGITALDVIDDWQLTFRVANAVKYIKRHPKKGKPIEDLQKAVEYLQLEVQRLTTNLTNDQGTSSQQAPGVHPAH